MVSFCTVSCHCNRSMSLGRRLLILAFISLGAHGLPTRSGKLKDLTRFDNTFFGVHNKQANRTDPQLRMLLEVTYEAIVDAGMILRLHCLPFPAV